ncbi:MAG: hypothetical protein HQK75_06435, partial [Candidatus Magnetomorum sp.]|nr:hypothetical protein [Candidatus Magnetomorum sp.]
DILHEVIIHIELESKREDMRKRVFQYLCYGLLIDQFVDFYKKVPEKTVSNIKKEVKMSFVATTITEYYINLGEERGERRGIELGEKRGEKRGEKKGILKGKLKTLKDLYKKKIITPEIFLTMSEPLQEQLKQLTVPLKRKTKITKRS